MAKYYNKKTKQWEEGTKSGGSMFPFFGFTSPKFMEMQEEYSDKGIAQDIVSPDDEMYMEGGGIPALIDYSKNVDQASPELLKALQDNDMDTLKKILGAPDTTKDSVNIEDLEPSMTLDQLQSGGKLPKIEEDEEGTTGKGYGELGFFQKLLKAATENPEATLALGRALLKGEGLGIGLADFAEEKISQDKAEAALEKEAAETLYERQLKEREFQLDVAKAEDLARYYEQMGYAAVAKTDKVLDEIEYGVKYAQLSRDAEGKPLKPGPAEFDAKVIEGMENYSKDKKPDLASLLGVSTGGEDSQQVGTATVGTNTINVPYLDLGK